MYKWKVCPIQGRQLKDVRKEDLWADFRFCNTYRGGGGYDKFPEIAKKRGMTCKGDIGLQFVVQLYGCTLACPYCYVTADGIWGLRNTGIRSTRTWRPNLCPFFLRLSTSLTS